MLLDLAHAVAPGAPTIAAAAADAVPGASAALAPGGLLDPASILESAGPWVLGVVALMVFIESGVLFPFLPGDSLLFTSGMLHERLGLNLWVLLGVIFAAAVVGDQVGYTLGRRFGRRLFKPDARILKTEYLERTERFFAKWGGPALVLARFVPIVRTYTPLVAGLSEYPYRRFLPWNVGGALGWTVLITMLGVWLGQVPFVANSIEAISIGIVVVSLIPLGIAAWRGRRGARGVDGPTSSAAE